MTPYSTATLSPVLGIVSSPNCFSIAGFGKRAPMVESKTLKSRLKGVSDLANTKGARDMDSTPPARITSPSPQLIARAASITAARPEAHKRLTVCAGVFTFRPASKVA
ncbi:hypothetical protein D3C80_1289180 [compost metagenome]